MLYIFGNLIKKRTERGGDWFPFRVRKKQFVLRKKSKMEKKNYIACAYGKVAAD